MSEATFEAILAGLAGLDELPTIYFGGMGSRSHTGRRLVGWPGRTRWARAPN